MKILIVGPSWVGDMVMAQSLFLALQQEYKDCRIHVLAPDWSRPLLERMPQVEKAIPLPFGHGALELKSRREFAKALRSEGYDRAIVLPNSLKSALIPFWAKIPVRTGWRGEMRYGLLNDLRILDESHLPLMVQRFVALAFDKQVDTVPAISSPSFDIDLRNVATAVQKFSLQPDARPVLALCPGAEFGASKRWPGKHYAELAVSRLKQGWQVWIFGSKSDALEGDQILQDIPEFLREQCVNLAGKTSLAEAIDLLSLSRAVVTNDSGLMHIAAALNKPLVAVYGSTSPAFTPPLAERVRIETLNLSCSPCFERECPLRHNECMKRLEPKQVGRALDSLVGP